MRAVITTVAIGIVSFLLLGIKLSAHARSPEDLTMDEIRRLAARDILVAVAPDSAGGGKIDAVIEIATSPSKLISLMRDCGRSPTFIEGLTSCGILSQSPEANSDVREHIVKKFWFVPETRSVFKSIYDGQRSITFHRVEGDLRTMEGQWLLEPLQGGVRTRLFYIAHIDPGVPLPSGIVRAAIEAELPRTLAALRLEATRNSLSVAITN